MGQKYASNSLHYDSINTSGYIVPVFQYKCEQWVIYFMAFFFCMKRNQNLWVKTGYPSAVVNCDCTVGLFYKLDRIQDNIFWIR